MTSKFSRVVIENVQPEIEAGRFAIKRTTGESVDVTADIHSDGHDAIFALLKYRPTNDAAWTLVPMQALPNDAWKASFVVNRLGVYDYTLEAWIDRFGTWRYGLAKKIAANQDVTMDLLEGALFIETAAAEAIGNDARYLQDQGHLLKQGLSPSAALALVESKTLINAMVTYGSRTVPTLYARTLKVRVEKERARYGAWYEMFPRSCGTTADRSATLREAKAILPDISGMGFDVLYLPPVHPIGKSFRKGPNNATECSSEDPGSPWAIGSAEGGHKAIHPDLGSLADFDHFVKAAQNNKLEIALDIAFQCSPDHPYVREHPEWFQHRADGSIKYAENPPKKYEDIYPLDFECAAWESLWNELRDVVLFWVTHGVTIFRVDNPHTKPYRFWEWLIKEVQEKYPETVFLAEAFTRPKIMAQLAKCGFSQSYSYFTWRTTKAELTEYFTELNQTAVREYMRPNLFTNTPDILHAFLQTDVRAAFLIRYFLAATLGATYGIYGPSFELCDGRAIAGTEEYADSEKYQVRVWNRNQAGNIKDWITKTNHIRRQNPALQFDHRLLFHKTTNEHLLAYSKTFGNDSNVILVVVNLDPIQVQEGEIVFHPVSEEIGASYIVHDLLSDERYTWSGKSHYIRLDPAHCPAHIFKIEQLA